MGWSFYVAALVLFVAWFEREGFAGRPFEEWSAVAYFGPVVLAMVGAGRLVAWRVRRREARRAMGPRGILYYTSRRDPGGGLDGPAGLDGWDVGGVDGGAD